MNTSARRVLTIAAACTAVIMMTAGCGGAQMAEQLGEQAIGGDVEIDDDSITITDDEGNEFAAGSGTEIPESWPDNVPLFPMGDLILATSQSEGSATALWETSSSVDVAAAEYDSILRGAGFTVDQDARIAGAIVRTYSDAVYVVNVTVAITDGTTSVSVTVVPEG